MYIVSLPVVSQVLQCVPYQLKKSSSFHIQITTSSMAELKRPKLKNEQGLRCKIFVGFTSSPLSCLPLCKSLSVSSITWSSLPSCTCHFTINALGQVVHAIKKKRTLDGVFNLSPLSLTPEPGRTVGRQHTGVTVLLSLCVFSQLINDTLPQTSEAVPLLG